MLRSVFQLQLSRAEMGAVISVYGQSDRTVLAGPFLRDIIKLGLDQRNKDLEEARLQQINFEKERKEKILKMENDESELKSNLTIDFDFSDLDEALAMEKLKISAFKYDGQLSLVKGFECDSLRPVIFRDLLKRVFNLYLTNAEIGFIVRKFDKKNSGTIKCAPSVPHPAAPRWHRNA